MKYIFRFTYVSSNRLAPATLDIRWKNIQLSDFNELNINE